MWPVIAVLLLPFPDNDFGGMSGTRQVQPIPASSTIAGSMSMRSLVERAGAALCSAVLGHQPHQQTQPCGEEEGPGVSGHAEGRGLRVQRNTACPVSYLGS